VLAEVREWLHKAAEDVRTAEVSCAAQPPLQDAAAFHCQQAAEKALKGFLTLHARVFEKTHSIEKVRALALAADPTLRRDRPRDPADGVRLEVPLPWDSRRAERGRGRRGAGGRARAAPRDRSAGP